MMMRRTNLARLVRMIVLLMILMMKMRMRTGLER